MKRAGLIKRIQALNRAQFLEQFILPQTPVIIKNCIENWPAFELWEPDYFQEKIGQISVPYRFSNSNIHPDFSELTKLAKSAKKTSLAEFLNLFVIKKEDERLFLAGDGLKLLDHKQMTSIGKTLEKDFIIPTFLPVNNVNSAGLWISTAHINSWLHYDANGMHNLNAQIKGTKKVRLFPPQHLKNYYLRLYSESESGNFSEVNILNPDYQKYPLFQQTNYYEGQLNPGDAIYIPAYWLHTFEHLDSVNINLNFWWEEAINFSSPLLTRKLFIDACQQLLPNPDKLPFFQCLKNENHAYKEWVTKIEYVLLSGHTPTVP